MIQPGKTGYTVSVNRIQDYVSIISDLDKNRKLLSGIGKAASLAANARFDPVENTRHYEEFFMHYAEHPKKKERRKVYGSRLDQPWIPNTITKIARTFNAGK